VQLFDGTVPPVAGPKQLRTGNDITIVASFGMVERIQSAAQELEGIGISAELFDLRVIRPLHATTIIESVTRTNRLLVVEENHSLGGWGGELIATVVAEAFDHLDAPPERLTLPDWPMPYSPRLEDAALPSVEAIVARARDMVEGRGR
jgi:pyruvate dehydrogenase E1 component beta subunit